MENSIEWKRKVHAKGTAAQVVGVSSKIGEVACHHSFSDNLVDLSISDSSFMRNRDWVALLGKGEEVVLNIRRSETPDKKGATTGIYTAHNKRDFDRCVSLGLFSPCAEKGWVDGHADEGFYYDFVVYDIEKKAHLLPNMEDILDIPSATELVKKELLSLLPLSFEGIKGIKVINFQGKSVDYFGNKFNQDASYENAMVSLLVRHPALIRDFWINIFHGATYRDTDQSCVIATLVNPFEEDEDIKFFHKNNELDEADFNDQGEMALVREMELLFYEHIIRDEENETALFQIEGSWELVNIAENIKNSTKLVYSASLEKGNVTEEDISSARAFLALLEEDHARNNESTYKFFYVTISDSDGMTTNSLESICRMPFDANEEKLFCDYLYAFIEPLENTEDLRDEKKESPFETMWSNGHSGKIGWNSITEEEYGLMSKHNSTVHLGQDQSSEGV